MASLNILKIARRKDGSTRFPRYQEVVAKVVASDVVPTGAVGELDLMLTFEVVAGSAKGQRVTQYIPLWNRDAEVRRQGDAALKALCDALGMEKPEDSEEFHGKPLTLCLTRTRGEEDRPQVTYWACDQVGRTAGKKKAAQSKRSGAKTSGKRARIVSM